MTVHINKSLNDKLNRIKGNRSYSQILIDILQEKIDLQRKFELIRESEDVILYNKGYNEGEDEYEAFYKSGKCNRINILS